MNTIDQVRELFRAIERELDGLNPAGNLEQCQTRFAYILNEIDGELKAWSLTLVIGQNRIKRALDHLHETCRTPPSG